MKLAGTVLEVLDFSEYEYSFIEDHCNGLDRVECLELTMKEIDFVEKVKVIASECLDWQHLSKGDFIPELTIERIAGQNLSQQQRDLACLCIKNLIMDRTGLAAVIQQDGLLLLDDSQTAANDSFWQSVRLLKVRERHEFLQKLDPNCLTGAQQQNHAELMALTEAFMRVTTELSILRAIE
ncbi:hypothetical protein [Leptolyngbya sp. FACHB-261]|uniref:hypothetical protein n=1 Tax=Leptolyngbya sp. FACHB-261 TaxID=2692806 RepID=UPI001684781C|nr:hypothetical protein [Leptolyngbya sp. FACHB-261]MBD2102815.1 hypothetical protein [Leptolyngbya sp. FACHB-261]